MRRRTAGTTRSAPEQEEAVRVVPHPATLFLTCSSADADEALRDPCCLSRRLAGVDPVDRITEPLTAGDHVRVGAAGPDGEHRPRAAPSAATRSSSFGEA